MIDKVRQEHKRRDGSVYHRNWTLTEWRCVGCGARTVWEDDCEDYYTGTRFVCASCGAEFRLPGASDPKSLSAAALRDLIAEGES